jgi:hypothetical protein
MFIYLLIPSTSVILLMSSMESLSLFFPNVMLALDYSFCLVLVIRVKRSSLVTHVLFQYLAKVLTLFFNMISIFLLHIIFLFCPSNSSCAFTVSRSLSLISKILYFTRLSDEGVTPVNLVSAVKLLSRFNASCCCSSSFTFLASFLLLLRRIG